jgi:hypothetical protein
VLPDGCVVIEGAAITMTETVVLVAEHPGVVGWATMQ